MRRFLALVIISIPALIIEYYVFHNGLHWLSTGIFELDWSSFNGAFLYLLITGILKLLILGMIYWYFLYLLVTLPVYLFTHKIPGIPEI